MKNKNAQPSKAELSAKTRRNFIGTRNFRHMHVIRELLHGPLFRQDIDRIVGCSNGPALIAAVRRLGLEIPCVRMHSLDAEGRPGMRGVYRLSASDKDTIERYKQSLKKEGV